MELEGTKQRLRTFVRPTLHYTNPVMLYEKTVYLIIQMKAYISSLNRNMQEWIENIIFSSTGIFNMSNLRGEQTPDIAHV
jgi:hypothetical protein